MSKQSVYTVHSGDECGGDPCYNVLKGPAGFECWLTEPEDRSFWRDLAPVVERLEHLEQSNEQLREQNRVLREALVVIQKSVNTRDEYASWLLGITEAALTATSQPAKEPVRHLCGARGFGQSLDDRCPGCAATSQEGQG